MILGWIISRLITATIRRLMTRARVEPSIVGFTANLLYFAMMAFVIIAALQKLGLQTNSLVAAIGAAGLAVGFALQGSLSNFAAGIILILFRPFRVGDYIEGAGIAGTVQEIQVFATTFNTPDNKKIIVPNAQLTGGAITNYSAMPTRRIDLTFAISYTDNIDAAKSIIADVLKNDPRILPDPAPLIAVAELADSSVNIIARPWVKPADFWDVRFDAIEAVKKAFDARNITIPFPQHDVHVRQVG